MIQDAQDIAKTTLAACASFSSLVDDYLEAGQTAADRIYHDSFPQPLSGRPEHSRAEYTALRPCAIVYTEDNQGFDVRRDAMGDQNCWTASGVIHMMIFRNVPEIDKNNPAKVDTDFRTIIGNIVNDLIGLSETGGYLSIRRFTISGPARTPVNELSDVGDAQMAEILAYWGVGD